MNQCVLFGVIILITFAICELCSAKGEPKGAKSDSPEAKALWNCMKTKCELELAAMVTEEAVRGRDKNRERGERRGRKKRGKGKGRDRKGKGGRGKGERGDKSPKTTQVPGTTMSPPVGEPASSDTMPSVAILTTAPSDMATSIETGPVPTTVPPSAPGVVVSDT